MNRRFRIFFVLYAALMMVIPIGQFIHSFPVSRDDWSGLLFYAPVWLAYVVVAIGYWRSKEEQQYPSRSWLLAASGLLLGLPLVGIVVDVFEKGTGKLSLSVAFLGIPACIAVSFLLLREGNKDVALSGRLRLWLTTASFLLGAGLVLASLFLKTAYDEPGWKILMDRAPWITSEVNVGHGIFGPTVAWLQPFYAYTGSVMYWLSILCTLGMLAYLPVLHISYPRVGSSRVLRVLACLTALAGFWVLTDIFWGWNMDLSEIPWLAAIGTGLWMAGPIFAVVLIAPNFRSRLQLSRLGAFVLFQLPITAFNVFMLPVYAGSEFLLGGLGVFILGIQLESWACLEFLILIQSTSKEDTRQIVAAVAA